MNSDNIYYTYILCNPLKPGEYKVPNIDLILPCEPFYVGMGHDGRINDHEKRVRTALKYRYEWFFTEGSIYKNSIIKQLISKNLKVERVLVKENVSKKEAAEAEELYINLLGRKDLGTGILANLTEGGENGTYERKVSLRKGFKQTSTYRGRASNPLPVIRICPFDETITRFESIREIIGKDAPDHERIMIGNVCRGYYLQKKGYIYMWEKDFNQENLKIRLENFFSQNPQRLAIAKKEYRRRYAESCSK
jgi:hypothetical protein